MSMTKILRASSDELWFICRADSFVVKPLFFRGGDIGRLAVPGTVNDLAVTGPEPCRGALCGSVDVPFQSGGSCPGGLESSEC